VDFSPQLVKKEREPRLSSNLLFNVLGKTVWVQVDEEYHVKGKLIHFQKGNRKLHVPPLLILQLESGDKVICRWRKLFWK
jgi:hypothetical protein